jgi:hypothetical protein
MQLYSSRKTLTRGGFGGGHLSFVVGCGQPRKTSQGAIGLLELMDI